MGAMKKALAIGLGVIFFLLAGAAVAVAAYDHAHRDVISPGVRVAGVPVGGLHAAAARARVRAALRAPLTTPLVVHSRGRHWTLSPARAHAAVDVDGLVARAVADSRQGSVVTRTVHGLTGAQVSENLPARVSFSQPAVDRLVHRVAGAVARPARDATVDPSASGLHTTPSHTGRRLAASNLRRKLEASLARPHGARSFRARLVTVQPKVTTSKLDKRYPSYIIIDRAGFTLRLYRHLKLWHTYPIAVGRQGLETPAGLYDVQWKQTNPSWYVPNSAWAGALAGKVIPPGPDDPIKARWMAFNGGAGIHGIDPSEYGSIGHNASHGCVRMRIPDVIQVYAVSPVHTPVFVA
jgi:lipoprotein-anchoring transpeptidase ErfK/SrfK